MNTKGLIYVPMIVSVILFCGLVDLHPPLAKAQISPLLSFNVSHSTTAISLIAHTPCVGGVNGATTAAMNTTGANFLVINVTSAVGTTNSVSDSLANTWHPLTNQNFSGVLGSQLFYATNATVGATHTFNNTSTASSSAICVAAFSHVNIGAPFDQQSGSTQGFATTIQPGSLTPSVNNSLVVTGAAGGDGAPTVNAPFTLTDNIGTVGGVNYSCGLAYSIQTTPTAVNPTWTQASGTTFDTGMAVFKQ